MAGQSATKRENSARRPSGANEDGAPTLRNVIPWREMERKLAEKLAAKAAAGELSGEVSKEISKEFSREHSKEHEKAPDSGVRAPQFPAVGEPDGPLTYQVYSVADLEARQVRSGRASMLLTPAVVPSRWPEVWRLLLQVFRSAADAYRFPKPRPRLVDMCRPPFREFLTELKAALRALPWKKIGFATGATFGAFALLMLAVLTTAELTDDLKPGAKHSVVVTPAVSASTPASTTAAPPPAPPTTIVVVPAPAPVLELDDPPSSKLSAAKARPKPKRK